MIEKPKPVYELKVDDPAFYPVNRNVKVHYSTKRAKQWCADNLSTFGVVKSVMEMKDSDVDTLTLAIHKSFKLQEVLDYINGLDLDK